MCGDQVATKVLRNRYFVLRHGQSEANQLGLIASSPAVAVEQYGLTDHGRQQVAEAVSQRQRELADVSRIYTSDFRRARETAEIAGELLRVPVEVVKDLRERDFGDWDGQPDENYQLVWSADEQDPTHQRWGVESVQAVAERMTGFIDRIDQTFADQSCLIVAHGDPLQILITAMQGRDLRGHRRLDPLKTAELRPLL